MLTAPAPESRTASIAMHELTPYAEAPHLQEAHTESRGLALSWTDGAQARLPWMWLRDHCACHECRHPQTRERLVLPRATTEPATEVCVTEGHLHLAWPDGHTSVFHGGWLHQRRPAAALRDPLPAPRPWDDAYTLARVRHIDFLDGDGGERAWLEALLRDGLVLLEDGPLADEEVSRLATRIGPLRSTNFGARFDVQTKPDPNNAAYTAIGLALHTDLPNWRQPPDIQLLYCLENDAEGGESQFADGYQVAEALRREDPEAFRLLSETPIDFRFQDEEQDIAVRAPILTCNTEGRVVDVRFNNWIRDTLRLPVDTIVPWYRAYHRFWDMLHETRHQLEFSLAPGEMIAFDNRRVLHGRGAFDPNSGRRHLQGTYLDRDMLESRLRVLARDT